MSFNTSIQMLTVGWNAKRFAESKSAHKAARRSVFRAATTMLKTELKSMEYQNDEIRHEINRCHSDLAKYDDKLQILDNMTQLATQSLEVYFQARMENMRTFVMEQCRIISDGIQEEADHWKEIHAMLQQKLVVPGDLRSYGGGNGLPRAVRQSPGFSRIIEEEEEEAEEEEDEEAENQHNMTTILQSRTMTPLVTQSLKKARLLASKLSNDISKLNMSTTVHEETMIEEPLPTVPTIPDTHVTLRDVSVIEKTNETEHIHPNPELSVSLLPCIPTVTPEEEEPETEEEINNKSIASTISDKTFVKTSLKPTFSSDADSDDDDDEDEDEDTIIEDSIIPDETENARPLLLTADRSIRRPPSRVIPNLDKSIVKQEKVSLKEPLNTSNKSLLSNNKTFDAEKSDFVRPTIVELANTSKLPTIPSVETNEEEEEENQPVISEEPKPIVELPPVPVETNSKRRTTRRTTTRLLRDNQNVENPPPVEIPVKTRYATRYSTRLASSVSHEEVTVSRRSTMHRRTTRFTSE